MIEDLTAHKASAGDDQAKGIGRKDQKRQQDDCGEGRHKRQRKGTRGIKAGTAEEVKLHGQSAVTLSLRVDAPGERAHDAKGEQAEERKQVFSFCPDRRRAPLHL